YALFVPCYVPNPLLHSFPTRRSSDLLKEILKTAAPPYLYSGPSPVASLATAIEGLKVNAVRGDELRASLYAKTRRILDCLDELRSEEHTSELQSRSDLVCRLLLEKKK